MEKSETAIVRNSPDVVPENKNEKKKTLNTPSQNVNVDRLGEFYGLNRSQNETNFEYEKSYIPSITRILSGSNGRHDDISDILLRTVTATPNVQHKIEHKPRTPANEVAPGSSSGNSNNNRMQDAREDEEGEQQQENKKVQVEGEQDEEVDTEQNREAAQEGKLHYKITVSHL